MPDPGRRPKTHHAGGRPRILKPERRVRHPAAGEHAFYQHVFPYPDSRWKRSHRARRDAMIILYIAYLMIGISVAAWAGQTLQQRASTLLASGFAGSPAKTSSAGHMIVLGYY